MLSHTLFFPALRSMKAQIISMAKLVHQNTNHFNYYFQVSVVRVPQYILLAYVFTRTPHVCLFICLFNLLKTEAQTALFKGPVRTAL
jgi:hypothetical protein